MRTSFRLMVPRILKKIRHAQKEGIHMRDYPVDSPPDQHMRERVDARIQEWVEGRKGKGKQVHMTDVHPWQDIEHRQYHAAIDQAGKIHCFIVLAMLSSDHGWQLKFGLDFVGAASGAIEMAVMHALENVAAAGCTSVTFGGGASHSFTPGHNMKGTRVKVLSKTYSAIAKELKLTNKSEFRNKLGTSEQVIPDLSCDQIC